MDLSSLVTHPIAHAVIVGVLSAASVDYAAFRSWKSWDDAHTYNWGLASWRWFQGGLAGLVAGAGLNALLGTAGTVAAVATTPGVVQ